VGSIRDGGVALLLPAKLTVLNGISAKKQRVTAQ
jgi:hypothetical protein